MRCPLVLRTSPTKDDVLFQTMASKTWDSSFTPGLVTPLPKVSLAQGPSVPLATWVRWELSATGSGGWDLTFRVLVSANRVWR